MLIFFSSQFNQVTWGHYIAMVRMLKKYDFAMDIPGRRSSFSGYPGSMYSGDDFNVMQPSQLMTLETTIVNYNDSLWDMVKPTDSIFTTFRATVANRWDLFHTSVCQ